MLRDQEIVQSQLSKLAILLINDTEMNRRQKKSRYKMRTIPISHKHGRGLQKPYLLSREQTTPQILIACSHPP